MTTLLSIDWDWVTGDCSDIQHGCCGWCTPSPRRHSRGSDQFVKSGWIERLEALRALVPSKHGGNLWVAECHADILRVVNPDETTDIIHLDSHLDDANWCVLSCGSWRTFLPTGIEVAMPQQADLKELAFKDVFVCQSSPWTPSGLDKFLWSLIRRLADILGRDPIFIGHRRMVQMRAYQQTNQKGDREARIYPSP